MASRHQPNVLLIHCDQLRYDGLGCNGNQFARTPNIDALAAEGCVFTRHIAGNPICMPSRACLMTGMYPLGHNLWCNGVALPRAEYADPAVVKADRDPRRPALQGPLVSEPATMADVFAAGGYSTACLGKLHLTPWMAPASTGYHESTALWKAGTLDDWRGPYYGFEHAELALGHGENVANFGPYAQWLAREHPQVHGEVRAYLDRHKRHDLPIPSIADLYPSVIPSDCHVSSWLAGRFIGYLNERADAAKPWMAFVGFPDPHHAFSPSYDVVRHFENIDVPDPLDPAGDALAISPALRRAQQDIRSLTVEQRRMIVRYTYAMIHQIDQAVGRMVEAIKQCGQWDRTVIVFTSDHGDYLGDHGQLRKGFNGTHPLLHVPFVMRAPGAGLPSRVDTPMSNVDVLPTLAGLAGVTPPSGVQGRDILSLVRSGGTQTVFYYGHNGDPQVAQYGAYDAHHRLSYHPHERYAELYDHRSDPAETRNLAEASTHRDIARSLLDQVRDHLLHSVNPALNRAAFW